MALQWDLRIMLLFRRPTTFQSMALARSTYIALRKKVVGSRKSVKKGQGDKVELILPRELELVTPSEARGDKV